MFGFSVDTSEVTALADTLAEAHAQALAKVQTVTAKTTKAVERDAKTFAPVDTGNLRSGIGSEVTTAGDSVTGEIYATASYAHYVEHGTSRMAPRAFLGPSLDRNLYAFEKAITLIAAKLGAK